MSSQQHEQGQLHKRLPSASYASVGDSTSAIECDGRGADKEHNKSSQKTSGYASTTGSTGATTRRVHDNSSTGGRRGRRRRLSSPASDTRHPCFKCRANDATATTFTTRQKWLALAVLGTVSASAAAALVFLLVYSDSSGIAATDSTNNNKSALSSSLESPGEGDLAGILEGQEAGSGWAGGAGKTGSEGVRGGIRATGQAKTGGGIGEKDSAPGWFTLGGNHGKRPPQGPTLVHGGSSSDNGDGDNPERVEGVFEGGEGEGVSSDSRGSMSAWRGEDRLGADGGGVSKDVVTIPGSGAGASAGAPKTEGSENAGITTNTKGSHNEVPHLPKKPPVLSGSAKTCDGYLKDYGIVPGDSWGTAPKRVQDAWINMNCDRVLAMSGFSLDDPPSGGRQRAIVLVWNDIAGWLDYLRPAFVSGAIETCKTECIFTNDRSLLPMADGVLFHGPTLKMRDAFPKVKPPGVDYVFANLEPTTYRNVQSLLRNTQVMSQFDLRMTYEGDSDVPLGYVGSSSTSRYFKAPKATFQEKDGFGSPDAIAAFVSNCKAAGATKRMKYMEELMKHATVHSFGYCLHNREEPQVVPGDGATNRQENKVALLSRYKFLLAFENNNQLRDYVTEKVYNGLQSGTLPVYWGAENVEDYVPKGSVVKASDFSSPAELGKHLKMLATNEEAYEAYFQWRDDPEEEKKFEQDVISRSAYGVNAMCRLCDRVVLDKDDKNGP